jgi:hypothetical protein
MNQRSEIWKLTTARGLLEALFAEEARPSARWLRSQQRLRVIPHVRLGGRVFFDPEAVRQALATHEAQPNHRDRKT